MEQATQVQRRSPLRSLIKAILHFFVKIVVLINRAIKRAPIVAMMLLVAVVGSLMWLGSNPVSIPLLGISAPAIETAPAGSPRVSVETYLTGQRQYEARMMWESMSDELKQAMAQRNQSLEALQRQMEQAKRNGIKYTGFQYVGGTDLSNGRSVHLYIVSAAFPQQQGGDRSEEIPYTFTVDRSGKIANID